MQSFDIHSQSFIGISESAANPENEFVLSCVQFFRTGNPTAAIWKQKALDLFISNCVKKSERIV